MPAPKGNQFALGNNGGRPRKYETAEELLQAVQEYFAYLEGDYHEEEIKVGKGKDQKTIKEKVWDRNPEDATITGLALFLGFDSRSTLYEYGKKEEFSHIIKRAASLVEKSYEHRLAGNSPTGARFALKNMGWKDKSEVDMRTPEGVTVVYKKQEGNAPLIDGD